MNKHERFKGLIICACECTCDLIMDNKGDICGLCKRDIHDKDFSDEDITHNKHNE